MPGGGRGQVRAHPGVDRGADALDLALAVRRKLHVLDVIPAVDRGLVPLAAGGRPLHGPARLHGAEHGYGLVRVVGNLAAEAAAHLGGDDPHLVLRHTGDHGREEPDYVRVLGRRPEGQLPGGLRPLGDRGARLHGVRYQALVEYPLLDHHVGAGEGLVGVIAARHHPVERLVVGRVLVELRGAIAHCLLGVDDRRKRVVLDLDELQRILGCVAVLRNHHRHGVPLVPHRVVGDREMVDRLEVGVREQPRAWDGGERGVDVRARVHGHDAVHRRGGARVYARDLRVGVGAAEDGRVGHARQHHVVGVGRAARDEPRVLATPYS